jgi:DNA (cytosine-5)-methyltransferase 1
LYAGIGGNRKNWKGEVTAVERNATIGGQYKRNFPNDKLLFDDAQAILEASFERYDFIWASPPCQTLSSLNAWTRHDIIRMPNYEIYEVIDFLKKYVKCKWVVENVVNSKHLINPNAQIGRHVFWSNFYIPNLEIKRLHNFSKASRKELVEYLGIDYVGNIYFNGNHDPCQILRNCVHPKIGEHVLNMAINQIDIGGAFDEMYDNKYGEGE